MDVAAILHQLGVPLTEYAGSDLAVCSPINGSQIASLRCHTQAEVQASMAQASNLHPPPPATQCSTPQPR